VSKQTSCNILTLMKNKVNWGILSTAHINHRIIPAIGESPRAELRAVASRDASRASRYAAQWDIETGYGSYEELLNDPEIDVVYISLPNDLHTEWIVKALKARKHVLCEKPMCLSLREFDEIERAQKETGQHVAEALMYLHHPQTKFFKSLVDDGTIGELRSMMSAFTATFSRGEDNYRLSNPLGGGSLWDLGVYPISFFQFLTASRPEKCFGIGRPEKLDLRFSGLLSYPDGITGQFTVSFDSAYSTQTILIGAEGFITISHPFNNSGDCRAWYHGESEIKELDVPRHALFLPEIEDMNDVVLISSTPAILLDQSRGHVETILKLRASAGY
jgi:D-xylose 1-dehydrogenase (NADP+, D-xylono-1,5-lactone-forming)